MQPLYKELESLDKRACKLYGLDEIILMENAAIGLQKEILKKIESKKDRVLFICGPGNNGADGIACARLIKNRCKVSIYLPYGVKSKLAIKQLEIAKALNIKIEKKLTKAQIVIDAIFGSKARELDIKSKELIEKINKIDAHKIACDMPTGLGLGKTVFKADTTVTMGALKETLFLEEAKDFIGELKVASLGLPKEDYEIESNSMVLEKKDLTLPFRNKELTHKGKFGHLVIIGGKMEGASILAAVAGFAFGAGLVSILTNKNTPPHIMKCDKIPLNSNVIVAGMGLGDRFNEEELRDILKDKVLVLDADMLKMELVKEYLNQKTVLTPHPKEFSYLLKHSGFGEISVKEIQANRFELAREFSEKSSAVLVLKGVNTIVAKDGKIYICPFGSNALSKGGSGDVLAGMIGSLLAQGYEIKEAAINGVLAHALAAKKFSKNNYALTPQDIIKEIKCL